MSFINGVKGFLIGIALVIPGLSGSIFAVVVGLYEKLLDAINHFRQSPKEKLKFLWPIGLGAVIGILASTKAILWICEQFPIPAYTFFIGLVLGIIPFMLRKVKQIKFNPLYLFISLVGFFLILLLSKLGAGQSDNYIAIQSLSSWNDVFVMLFAGAFSVSLMAIPGISGSIMLMVISQYGTVYNAVGKTLDWLVFLVKGDFTAAGKAFNSVLLILPFMIGALVGLVLIAKLMGFLLKHFESQVYYGVFGVVIAAIWTLIETGVMPYWPTAGGSMTVAISITIVMITIGILATLFLDKPDEMDTVEKETEKLSK